MKALRFHETGPISNLVLEEVEAPERRKTEALVRWRFAALNPADYFLVQGQYPRAGAPPFTPGRDGSGEIAEPGESGRFKKGDKVVLLGGDTGISRQGTLAQISSVHEPWLARLPEGWSMEVGAATPLAHLTAWQALVDRGGLLAGENVLVTGASGGVGTAAVVLANALGAFVVALSRDEKKREALVELGAEAALDAAAPGLEGQIKEAFAGGRAHLIIDNLGGSVLNTCLGLAAPEGRIQVVGLLAGLKSEITVGLIIHKSLRLQGINVGHYTPQGAQDAWGRIVQTLQKVRARVPIDGIFPMDRAQDAFARLQSGPLGKVLIEIP